jgi:DNA-directed RNA polymerase subunit beta'
VKDKQKVKKGDVICSWDPYNAVIVSDSEGKIAFKDIIDGITYKDEIDEQTGFKEKVLVENRDKKLIPAVLLQDKKGETLREFNLPVGAHISVEDNAGIKSGEIIAKIPRVLGKTGDITGGLPRVTELFEARNPSNPAVVSEIDGVVSYGGIKRGNREIIIESKEGVKKKYLVSLSKHILVQDNDFVKAGTPLSDGSITPKDILAIEGPSAVHKYIVNGIQEVYRLQGVKINDKHIEVIVRQMLRKVDITDGGDTSFIKGEQVDYIRVMQENQAVLAQNKFPAKFERQLMGITKASLSTDSFISAASFQETTRVLTEAAVTGKEDDLRGLKENVVVGRLIPAGTGLAYHLERRRQEAEAAEHELVNDFSDVDQALSQAFSDEFNGL